MEVVLDPTPSNHNVAKALAILTVPFTPSRPISTDSAVDVVIIDPLALTAGATTPFVNVLVVVPNVNRVAPAGLSTKYGRHLLQVHMN